MGLMLGPNPTFRAWQNNMASTPSNSIPGTNVTASSSVNTKGSYAQLISSTDYDSYGFFLIPANATDPNVATTMLFDIAVGGSGSEVVVLSNIMLTTGTNNSNGQVTALIPIFIPKGTRIAARCQSVISSQQINLTILMLGGGSVAPWQTYAGAETLGADTANSRFSGHTAGSSGTYSTYADFGGTSSRAYKAIMPLLQQQTDTTMTSLTMWLRIGIGGTTLAQWFTVWANTEYTVAIYPNCPMMVNIPSGTQFQCQATCSTTADSDFSIGLLGFY